MTGAEFLTLLMGRLAGRTDPALRANALLEAKLVQQTELEGGAFLPWFLISESASASLIIGERRLEIPDDFLREIEDEGSLIVINSEGKEKILEKKSYDELINWHGAEADADVPENYAIVGAYFTIFPLPKLALTVKMRYYAGDTLVNDSAVETKWLKYASDLLLAHTGYNVATKHLAWPEKAAEFNSEKSTAMSRLIASGTAREEANRARRMG